MGFSEKIKTLRQECLLSQEAFAKELGVSFATVNRWEKGTSTPRPQQVYAFEKYCEKRNVYFKENQ